MERANFDFSQTLSRAAYIGFDIEEKMNEEARVKLDNILDEFAPYSRTATLSFSGIADDKDVEGEMVVRFHREDTSFSHAFGVQEDHEIVIDSIEAYRYEYED